MKVLTIVGARPQFIKASVVSEEFEKRHDIEEILLHTGQHYDENMSGQIFDELNIRKPHYNLGANIYSSNEQVARMMLGISSVIRTVKPNLIVVFGDTNSTLAGALSASQEKISICHIEAGLRSFNRNMPEEVNRVITDHLSDVLYAPTEIAMRNLEDEGLIKISHNYGDVMYDAVLRNLEIARKKNDILSRYDLVESEYILATIHRPINTDDISNLKKIFSAFLKISKHLDVIVPLHPRTRSNLSKLDVFPEVLKSIKIIEPLSYLDILNATSQAKLIITDSGGLQKEAYFLNKYCITLRKETEWKELVEIGVNHLVDPEIESNLAAKLKFIADNVKDVSSEHKLFGDGNASKRIVKHIEKILSS